MNTFYVAGMGVAILIELLLVSKKNKSESDNILTIWMFLMLVHMFFFYTGFTGDIYNLPWLLGIDQPLPLIHGVFLYLYVSYVTKQLPKNKAVFLLHFTPVGLIYLYLLVTFFPLPPEQKIAIYKSEGVGFELFTMIKTYAIFLSGVSYVVWSSVLLRRHQKNIRDQFSDVEKLNLRWLQLLTFGLGGIWFLVIVFGGDALIFAGVVVFIFLIGFFGVRQADVFARGRLAPISQNEPKLEAKDEPDEPVNPGPKEKYQKSGLSDEASEKLHQELKRLMTEGAAYKQSDLSINDLSSKLGVHPNYLSQVINQKENRNFYDFVNTYRIEEFKRLIGMQKNQQFTLLSLAYDCGFSSKTAFNRFFKKTTGQTPSEYASAITGISSIPAE